MLHLMFCTCALNGFMELWTILAAAPAFRVAKCSDFLDPFSDIISKKVPSNNTSDCSDCTALYTALQLTAQLLLKYKLREQVRSMHHEWV